MKIILLTLSLACMVVLAGGKDKDKDSTPIPVAVSIPGKFTNEIQVLGKQYADLTTAQRVLDLMRDNLGLRICAEVGYAPDICKVDWQNGKVNKVAEIPKPPSTPSTPAR